MRPASLVCALACLLLAPGLAGQQPDSQAKTGAVCTRHHQPSPVVLSGVDLAAWVLFSPAARAQLRQLEASTDQPGSSSTRHGPAVLVPSPAPDSQAKTGKLCARQFARAADSQAKTGQDSTRQRR